MKVAERKPYCLGNWFPAGTRSPLCLTVSHRGFCRQTLDVRRRCGDLAVATHRFHRINRLPCPSRQHIYKSFMDFGRALADRRNPETRICVPKFLKGKLTNEGSFRAPSRVPQDRYNWRWRGALPVVGSMRMDHTLPKDIYHGVHNRLQNGRRYLCLNYWKEPEKRLQPNQRGARSVDAGINPHHIASKRQADQKPIVHYATQGRLRVRA